jgi:hypothetical protein
VVAAFKLIPSRKELFPIAGVGHELITKKNHDQITKIVEAFRSFAYGAVT